MTTRNKSILFFDGDCGLCNRAVRFLIKRDRHRRLQFAPLQGIAAQSSLPPEYRETLSTAVYHRSGNGEAPSLYVRSEAFLRALADVGGFWRFLAGGLRCVPRCLRDWCYERVANNRRHFFKKAVCRLPTREEQARILA